ncbi:EFR1 family ferrodoxin [Anaerosacchariphilus polymeriproducens]|uniref:4Fe-4S ferredoxin-type domain-containing protein n=1 Tax=Anaerosacchariphilus polymeriproducens TaxID=1812858 RepID=A0A371AZK1_9FIRM|nr:EFR1 family ferrodoxin [Anaerosacchariphilus polymeriproducens]RDU24922.1 hypothetical protein DWV06_01460 [Anaerosacchariphilus polymeriproducens]
MNEIYYFSGTGNSKRIAEDIIEHMPQTKLFSIADVRNEKIETQAKTVGFVFPIYSLGIPRIVEKVIKTMEFQGTKFIYAVATMGGNYGIAFEQISKILKGKGEKLSATFSLTMGSNSNLFMKIPGTGLISSEEEQEKLYTSALEKLDTIVDCIKNRIELYEPDIKFSSKLISGLATKAFIGGLSKYDKGFRVSNCIKCGKCAKCCPVDNIEMDENGPKWLGKCEACLRCFNMCQNKAILYGKMDEPEMYKRYRRNIDIVTMD